MHDTRMHSTGSYGEATITPEIELGPEVELELAARSPGLPETYTAPPTGDERRQTSWFGGRGVDQGGYGTAFTKYGSMDDQNALFVGVRGGWLIDRTFMIGLGATAQTLDMDPPGVALAENPDYDRQEFGYAGLVLAYHLMPETIVHPFANVLAGVGGLSYSAPAIDDGDRRRNTDAVFVVEPEAGLETNVASFMRVQASLSYRRVFDVEQAGIDNEDLSGFTGGIGLLFGAL